MKNLKFRIYFRDDESFMSEPITLEDLLHEDWIEFENEEGTLSLPLKDFRFYYYKGSKAYELMQYTGLKDKNGKEIYEGDIVQGRIKDEGIDVKGIVVYCECGYYFIKDKDDEVEICIISDLEVIGNIYENPELLEE